MSTTAPKGFSAAGVAAGLKSSGALDVAVVLNHGPDDAAAAVFTTNRFPRSPFLTIWLATLSKGRPSWIWREMPTHSGWKTVCPPSQSGRVRLKQSYWCSGTRSLREISHPHPS